MIYLDLGSGPIPTLYLSTLSSIVSQRTRISATLQTSAKYLTIFQFELLVVALTSAQCNSILQKCNQQYICQSLIKNLKSQETIIYISNPKFLFVYSLQSTRVSPQRFHIRKGRFNHKCTSLC